MPPGPAVAVSTGVSMYLTKDAVAATLRQVVALAPRPTIAVALLEDFLRFLRRKRCFLKECRQ